MLGVKRQDDSRMVIVAARGRKLKRKCLPSCHVGFARVGFGPGRRSCPASSDEKLGEEDLATMLTLRGC